MFGLAEPTLGHLTQRDDREPRGAVGRARAASRTGASRSAPRCPLHARAHVRAPPHAGARGAGRPARAASTSTRSTPLRRRSGRHRGADRRDDGARSLDPVDEALELASATACGSTSTPPTAASSRCSTTGRAGPGRDRRRPTRRRRPAQARPPALRLRGGPVRRPGVGRLYPHDSPYTYFTSDELHLGEISLECSRAGAAAAALWLTLAGVPAPRALARSSPRRRAALAFRRAAARLRGAPPAPRARARHRHLLAAPATASPRSTPPRAILRAGMDAGRPGLPQHAADRRRRPRALTRSWRPTRRRARSCAACS